MLWLCLYNLAAVLVEALDVKYTCKKYVHGKWILFLVQQEVTARVNDWRRFTFVDAQCWTLEGNKWAGWMTLHGPHARQLDNGEDRPEGKLESGVDDITCTQYKNLIEWIMERMDYKGKEWQASWAPGARVRLWKVESLATPGLYFVGYYFKKILV